MIITQISTFKVQILGSNNVDTRSVKRMGKAHAALTTERSGRSPPAYRPRLFANQQLMQRLKKKWRQLVLSREENQANRQEE
ncbi:hypothetical protein DP115_15070 [Brasilonema octagenarum UFV-OR1]|uniref:Uncharacterized protein n=1 Tax=Brasilonema octagenarum UFV-OR1 TaxID=417115 RepID=A0ABX1M9B4_9CYAN|nr:hypothetical protein [Brasilonema octagenarum UFV-OR1]